MLGFVNTAAVCPAQCCVWPSYPMLCNRQ